jgi:hypothetical protein
MRKAKLIAGLATTIALAAAGPASANILPVATWPLNEPTGTVAHDTSFRGNTGTLQGSVSSAPGRFGRSLAFNGTGGAVNVPDSALLEPATNVTVSAWVNSSVSPGNYDYIVDKGATGCLTASYGLYTGPNGGLIFYVSNDGLLGIHSPDYGPGIWDGKWHSVVGTYDGSTVRLYVDGQQVGSGTPANGPIAYGLSTSNDLQIGAYSGCSLPFNGSIDQVRVFNRTLDPQEIRFGVKTSQLLPPVFPEDLVL